MTDNRNLLKLIPEQREDLQRWAQSRTLPAGDVYKRQGHLAGRAHRDQAGTDVGRRRVLDSKFRSQRA